jgi:hypothetical protein
MPEARERFESSSIKAVSQVVDLRPNRALYSVYGLPYYLTKVIDPNGLDEG